MNGQNRLDQLSEISEAIQSYSKLPNMADIETQKLQELQSLQMKLKALEVQLFDSATKVEREVKKSFISIYFHKTDFADHSAQLLGEEISNYCVKGRIPKSAILSPVRLDTQSNADWVAGYFDVSMDHIANLTQILKSTLSNLPNPWFSIS